MQKKEPEVIRDADGKVLKIIYNNFEKPIVHEVINGKLKRIDKDGPSLSSEEYAKIKRQIMGILRGKKKEKTTHTNPANKKKSKQFLTERKEAEDINDEIEKYIAKHKNISRTEAIKEVLRSMEQAEILPGLHKWRAYFLATGIKLMENGLVATSFWTEKDGKKAKGWQKFMDIFSAIRSQDHTTEFYISANGEQKKILSIREVTDKANKLLITYSCANQTERIAIQKQITETLKLLNGCRNEYKRQIEAQLETIVGLRDIKGRINPGAMAAKTIATLGLLYKRLETTKIILAKTILRKQMLEWEKERLDILFNFCANRITLQSRHEAFFGKKLVATQATIIDNKIKQIIDLLGTAFSSPYWERSNAAKERLNDARQALKLNNMAKTRTKLLDAHKCLVLLPVNF